MFGRIMAAAILAGVIAGVFAWGAHMVKVTPLILKAEVYEDTASAAHGHEHTAPDAAEWAPEDGLQRNTYTLLSNLITAVGFAFVLVGTFVLSGRDVDWRQGIFWGLAGFTAFHAAPSLGLPPELPGMQAADLGARQVWWIATAAATAAGLGLIFFARAIALKLAGVIAIVIPHVVGAPLHEPAASPLPAELAAEFAVASLVVAAVFWIVLGGLAGYFYRRLGRA